MTLWDLWTSYFYCSASKPHSEASSVQIRNYSEWCLIKTKPAKSTIFVAPPCYRDFALIEKAIESVRLNHSHDQLSAEAWRCNAQNTVSILQPDSRHRLKFWGQEQRCSVKAMLDEGAKSDQRPCTWCKDVNIWLYVLHQTSNSHLTIAKKSSKRVTLPVFTTSVRVHSEWHCLPSLLSTPYLLRPV